jgi:hypothetical protein
MIKFGRYPDKDVPQLGADAALLALEAEGFVLRGKFHPGAQEIEWCDRRLLARIHRLTINRLRAEIQPVSLAEFQRFLFAWQRVDAEHVYAALDARSPGHDVFAGYATLGAAARLLRVASFPAFAGAQVRGATDRAAVVARRAVLGQADEAELDQIADARAMNLRDGVVGNLAAAIGIADGTAAVGIAEPAADVLNLAECADLRQRVGLSVLAPGGGDHYNGHSSRS